MRLIPLTQGYFAKVDDEDYEWLSKWKWYAGTRKKRGKEKYPRVVRSISIGGKIIQIQMPREIMRARTYEVVDHINRDTLDNRKENLRLCSLYQNGLNKGLYRNNKSGYKGVSIRKDKIKNKYAAYIRFNKKLKHLGFFPTLELAATAYNDAATKFHGEFASLNTIKH